MTVSLHNRRKLEQAIRSLLDGNATTADGKLTWTNVAAVSGVSKATADRAVDLRDEFRRQVQQRTPVPRARPDPVSRPRARAELPPTVVDRVAGDREFVPELVLAATLTSPAPKNRIKETNRRMELVVTLDQRTTTQFWTGSFERGCARR